MSDSEDEEEEEEKNGADNAANDENRTTPHTNDEISDLEDEEDEEAADNADLRNSSDDELAVFRRVEQIGKKASALFDKDKLVGDPSFINLIGFIVESCGAISTMKKPNCRAAMLAAAMKR